MRVAISECRSLPLVCRRMTLVFTCMVLIELELAHHVCFLLILFGWWAFSQNWTDFCVLTAQTVQISCVKCLRKHVRIAAPGHVMYITQSTPSVFFLEKLSRKRQATCEDTQGGVAQKTKPSTPTSYKGCEPTCIPPRSSLFKNKLTRVAFRLHPPGFPV